LVAAQRQSSEGALYAAAAKLLEEVTVLRRIAESRRTEQDSSVAGDLEARAEEAERQAQQIQAMLRNLD
jgi:hypothetical protein